MTECINLDDFTEQQREVVREFAHRYPKIRVLRLPSGAIRVQHLGGPNNDRILRSVYVEKGEADGPTDRDLHR